MGADMIVLCIDFPEGVNLEEIKTEMLKKAEEYEETEQIKTVINSFFDRLNGREVARFSRLGRDFYITGGMSWGDSPTDTFDIFSDFWDLPEEITRIGED